MELFLSANIHMAMTFLVYILVADNVLLCVKSRPITENDHLYECVRVLDKTRIIFSLINGPIKCFCLRLE